MISVELRVEVDGEEISVRIESGRVLAETTDPREAAAALVRRVADAGRESLG